MIKLRTLVHPIVTNSAHVISSTKVLMPRWYRGYAVGGIEYAVISTGWQKAAKMVKSCCAVGCTNHYSKGTQIHFYRFPADTQKRALWVAAVRRKNWTPTENSWLCSTHFIHGKKDDDPLSPDYVLTVFAHTKSPMKR